MAERARALFVCGEEEPFHVFPHAFGSYFVDAADEGEYRGDGVVELSLGVCDNGVVEDVDEVFGVTLCIDFREHGVHAQELDLLPFFVFEIEVYEGIDEVVDGRLERWAWDLPPDEDLEDVWYGLGEMFAQVGVEVCYVEEEFEGLGKCHEVHGVGVHLRGAFCGLGVSLCVAREGEVYVICELVFTNEFVVVEICVVGHEEEDAGEQELVVDVFALLCN